MQKMHHLSGSDRLFCGCKQTHAVSMKTTGTEEGGVIFTLAESHFESDAAFQDPFIRLDLMS